MLHQGEGLPLGLEPCDDLAGVHAQLDDFEGNPPAHGLLLLRHEHLAEAALADELKQLVLADPRSLAIGSVGSLALGRQGVGGGVQVVAGLAERAEESEYFVLHTLVRRVLPDVVLALLQREVEGRGEEGTCLAGAVGHGVLRSVRRARGRARRGRTPSRCRRFVGRVPWLWRSRRSRGR